MLSRWCVYLLILITMYKHCIHERLHVDHFWELKGYQLFIWHLKESIRTTWLCVGIRSVNNQIHQQWYHLFLFDFLLFSFLLVLLPFLFLFPLSLDSFLHHWQKKKKKLKLAMENISHNYRKSFPFKMKMR